MNKPLKIVLFGLVTLSLFVIGSLVVMQSTTSAFAQAIPTDTPSVPTGDVASPSPTSGAAQTSPVAEVWDQFCVAKVPYTLLALPQNATFSVTQPASPTPTPAPGYTTADQIACNSVGTFRDKQVVVCRGPQLFSFSLKITSSGNSADFPVPLKDCALPHTKTTP